MNDFTRHVHLNLIKTQHGALAAFKQYVASVETQLGREVKTLRSDNGRQYMNILFNQYLVTKGIEHQPIAPTSHESHVESERLNRSIFQMGSVSLLSSGLPKNLWGEAVNMAVYVKN